LKFPGSVILGVKCTIFGLKYNRGEKKTLAAVLER